MLKKLRSPLYLALLLPALLTLTDLLSMVDHVYMNSRAKIGMHPASPSTIILSFDNGVQSSGKSVVGTSRLAKVLENLSAQMPHRVFVDVPVKFGEDVAGDAALARAIHKLQPDVNFVVRSRKFGLSDYKFTEQDFDIPASQNLGGAPVVLSAWNTNFIDYGLFSPFSIKIAGKEYPTLAPALAGVRYGWQPTLVPDYLVDLKTVPHLKADKFEDGHFELGQLTGRTVIVNSAGITAPVGFFGHRRVHPLALDMAGAEALGKPFVIAFGSFPILILTWLLIRAGSQCARKRNKFILHGLALGTTFILPAGLQIIGITLDNAAGILCAALYGSIRLWQLRLRRVQHTSTSGLPNLLALSAHPLEVGRDVVVAVIARYEEILATLPKDLHGECARQIARRLAVGSGIETIFNGEGGHFAWTEEARPLEMQLHHLEGMRALFSAPLEIGQFTFDTNIHFGLDRNEGLDALTRVNSALASANDALASGRVVELFEAERLEEASWELSLHANIDEGLRNGQIWLAFQSQWDFKTGLICGAEALIRWNHPTRGPISPDAFILQAERAGRIDALTYWVMEEAISAALALNTIGKHIQMSVNLSAQMVDKAGLVPSLLEIIRRRDIDPRQLTIEVTETSSVRNRPAAVQNLSQLRDIGFRLSIDDFGTGEASLTYLADLPSDELKLDRRFVSRILTHERERQIVRSIIDLAHALGQTVVAEGIEDESTYRMLGRLGCDVGQGYHLGRPQPISELRKNLLKIEQLPKRVV